MCVRVRVCVCVCVCVCVYIRVCISFTNMHANMATMECASIIDSTCSITRISYPDQLHRTVHLPLNLYQSTYTW